MASIAQDGPHNRVILSVRDASGEDVEAGGLGVAMLVPMPAGEGRHSCQLKEETMLSVDVQRNIIYFPMNWFLVNPLPWGKNLVISIVFKLCLVRMNEPQMR